MSMCGRHVRAAQRISRDRIARIEAGVGSTEADGLCRAWTTALCLSRRQGPAAAAGGLRQRPAQRTATRCSPILHGGLGLLAHAAGSGWCDVSSGRACRSRRPASRSAKMVIRSCWAFAGADRRAKCAWRLQRGGSAGSDEPAGRVAGGTLFCAQVLCMPVAELKSGGVFSPICGQRDRS